MHRAVRVTHAVFIHGSIVVLRISRNRAEVSCTIGHIGEITLRYGIYTFGKCRRQLSIDKNRLSEDLITKANVNLAHI